MTEPHFPVAPEADGLVESADDVTIAPTQHESVEKCIKG